ncbi:VOC family protein [Saccharopolyspora rhizosphaerae]|uniref:VOC family protein n=1 Tax=Saccharopolyspora rhizosphaerae TaxID=2492662 RepID=A0A426JIT6_9PSEU|nr:VOC family protein [Saccharopolyspora rhizosphaerae]RRO13075.1 VOC family protein [Saccharopolyspora rhizosphaerae]
MAKLNPYLQFGGDARQALEFYHSVLGGDLALNTYGQFGQSDGPLADKIMHGNLTTQLGFTLMAADAPPDMTMQTGNNFSISISGEADDADALRGYFIKLAEGGQVHVPLEKQMWGDEFGMCTDRFGINWMVNISS